MKNANKWILRVKLIALGVFIFASAGVLLYGKYYEMPRRKCEAEGMWWSNKYRSCSAPIYLPTLTGRKAGEAQKVIWPSEDAAQVSRPAGKPAAAEAAPASAVAQ